ncbi:predicted protein [Botrytis cinerea T4]|uniref:Uncharacterized protein n=1 Tax=Botryotinia fuckeliana (strain T4) TaxID=999810 RepID=G2Y5V1_BOTF4|nr:predicted protein [Botrytis cinerea T4]
MCNIGDTFLDTEFEGSESSRTDSVRTSHVNLQRPTGHVARVHMQTWCDLQDGIYPTIELV